MRRAEAAGYVARRQFDCGGNAWRLTRKGTALAQEGELLCRECAAAPSLPDDDALDRCAACAVELCEARAQSADHAAAYHGKRAGARTDEAAKHRARAEHFRSLTEPQAAAA